MQIVKEILRKFIKTSFLFFFELFPLIAEAQVRQENLTELKTGLINPCPAE